MRRPTPGLDTARSAPWAAPASASRDSTALTRTLGGFGPCWLLFAPLGRFAVRRLLGTIRVRARLGLRAPGAKWGGAFSGRFQVFTLDSGWVNYSGGVRDGVFLTQINEHEWVDLLFCPEAPLGWASFRLDFKGLSGIH